MMKSGDEMNLESIARMNKKAGEAHRHRHTMWEFILTVEGEGFIVVDGEQYPFRKGTVVCVPPGTLHYNTSENDYVHIAIRFKGFVNPTDKPLTIFQDDEDGTFESLAKLTLKLFYREDKADDEVLGLLCDVLCSLFVSAMKEKKNNEIEIVRDIIISNFTDPEFTTSDAFVSMNYSEGHFRKLFREQMGMTPVNYLTKLRLEYAKKLLEENSPNGGKVSYVAHRSGFYDQRYFSRLFKTRYKITPQQYRKQFISEEKNR